MKEDTWLIAVLACYMSLKLGSVCLVVPRAAPGTRIRHEQAQVI